MRARRTSRRKDRQARTRRESVTRFLGSIRLVDVLVFALTTTASVWGWVRFTLGADGDVGGGPAAAAIATATGSLVLVSLRFVQRPRQARDDADDADDGFDLPLLFLPVVTTPLILLAITPSDASTAGFLPWLPVAGVIGVTALLVLMGVLVGFVAFILLVWPALLLLDALRPPREGKPAGRGLSRLSRQLSRVELAGAAVVTLMIVAFGFTMSLVNPGGSGATTRARIRDTFAVWVTGRGEPAPSWTALALVVTIALTIWLTGRASRRALSGERATTPPSA